MRSRITALAVAAAAWVLASAVCAQQQPAPQQTAPSSPLDVIPDKMPFSEPYGDPIGAQRAQALIQAAAAEAARKGWAMNIAVVDSGANLVAFLRMDGAQLASVTIAEHKARTAAKFRRPTKVFEKAIQESDFKYIATLDDVVASRGGIPLVEHGKVIGAIGCSGGTGSQDEAVCSVAAAMLK